MSDGAGKSPALMARSLPGSADVVGGVASTLRRGPSGASPRFRAGLSGVATAGLALILGSVLSGPTSLASTAGFDGQSAANCQPPIAEGRCCPNGRASSGDSLHSASLRPSGGTGFTTSHPGQTGTSLQAPQRYELAAIWQSTTQESTLNRPEGIDVGSDGLIFIAERGNHRVSVWHADGKVEARWGRQGDGPGEFDAPEDVALDLPRQRLYVADTGNRRIQVLARPTGQTVAIWPDVGLPRGIAVDEAGLVYVADGETARVLVLDAEGQLRAAWNAPPAAGEAARSFDPRGLSVGPDGLVYVADHDGQRVLWFDRTGSLVGQLALDNQTGPGGAPFDAAVDGAANLYVSVERGVLRFRQRATYAATILPRRAMDDPNCPFPDPSRCPKVLVPIPENHEGVRRLVVRPDGGLYFTYAPQMRVGDAAFAYPARGFPSVLGPETGDNPRRAAHPFRLDTALDPFAVHVLDVSGQVRAYRQDGRPYDSYRTFRNGPGIDIATDLRRPDVTGVLTGNQVSLSSLRDFSGRAPRLTEVLEPGMLTRYDRVGDRVPDPRWWNVALTMHDGQRAVLDTGRARLVVRSESDQLAAAIRLQPESGAFRGFRDIDYDRQGNLWILARDGQILRLDPRGRSLPPLQPAGLAGRSAEALATAGDGGGAILTGDDWVVRFSPAGQLLAAWQPAAEAGPGDYTDLSIDEQGRVLVPDAAADRLLVFAPADGPGGPLADPEYGACQVTPAKRAAPDRLDLGETTELTLELTARCHLDAVLVIDTSCQASGERLNRARQAVATFAEAMTQPGDHLALVGFNDQLGGARLLAPLSADRFAIRDRGLALSPDCLPIALFPERRAEGRISDGLRAGREALLGPQARPAAAKVLILVSPSILDREIHERQLYGRWIAGSSAPAVTEREHALWEARRLREAGVRLYAVGVGEDSRPLGPPPEPTPDLISTHPADDGLLATLAYPAAAFRSASTPATLAQTLRQIALELSSRSAFESVVVTDLLPDNMLFVSGSDTPPAERTAGGLRWSFGPISLAERPTIRFRLQPLQPGIWPTNLEARATFEDGFHHRGSVVFPLPMVEVRAPTPLPSSTSTASPGSTPSASPTATRTIAPTATPTATLPSTPPPAPQSRFLPFLLVERCVPKTRPVDVILLVDTSSSMAGGKLAAATEAVRTFVGLLNLPHDQAALVTFDRQARVVQELTGNLSLLERALRDLTTQQGTRIDLGLSIALATARGTRARARADPVIVLLTDGRTQTGTEADALQIAASARELGITIYAIGLGADVLPDFLAAIAGDRSRLYLSPTEAELRTIYAAIARAIQCR